MTKRPSNHFPGMLSSLAITQIRSTIPELVAGTKAVCGTFINVTTDGTTGLVIGNTATAGANNNIMGIAIYNPNRVYPNFETTLNNALVYKQGDPLTILDKGDVAVYAEKAVSAGDPVFMRVTADTGLTVIGAMADGAGTGLIAITKAKFVESTTSAGMVIINVDF